MTIVYNKQLEEMKANLGGGSLIKSDTLIPSTPIHTIQSEFLNSMREREISPDLEWLIAYESQIEDWVKQKKLPIQKQRVVDIFPTPLETAIVSAYVDGYRRNSDKPIEIEFYECQKGLLIRVHYDEDSGNFRSKKSMKNKNQALREGYQFFDDIYDEVSITSQPGEGTDIIIALDYDNKIELDSRKNWLHSHMLKGIHHLRIVKKEDTKE